MKATRTNYDEMWEKYFDSYPGWLYIADCICPCVKRQEHEENTVIPEECSSSFFLSDPEDTSSDKFYPVDEYNGYTTINNNQNESCHDNNQSKSCCEHEESGNPCTIFEYNQENKSDNISKTETAEEIKPDKIIRCRPLTNLPDNIIFECDTGQGFAFVTKKEESLTCTPHKTCVPKTLGTISIDAACLKRPMIKVLFSCNIHFKPRSGQGTSQLEFILSRSCNNSAESPIGTWTFNVEDKSEQLSQTFKLSCCNSNSFPGFYNYYLRVMPVCIRNCSVLITNCHMDAFAQSKPG